MANLSIVPYSERYSEAHRVFAQKNWPGKRRRGAEGYIRWKFRGPRQGDVEGCLLALENEAVVGQMGLIPVDIRLGSQPVPAEWICNIMVDIEARGRLIGPKMIIAARARKKLLLGSNPNEPAEVVLKGLGFCELTGPRMMLLPIKLNHVLEWKVPDKIKYLIPFLAQIGRPIMAWRSRKLRRDPGSREVWSCSWQDLVPLIAQRQQSLAVPHVVHDLDFLGWRFSPPEGFSLNPGFMRTAAGGYAIIEDGGKYFYVMDWFAPDKDDFQALFHAIYLRAVVTPSQTIQALAQDEQEREWLYNAGFLAMRHPVKILCYPPKDFTPLGNTFSYCWYDSDGNL